MANGIYKNLEGKYFHFGAQLRCHLSYIKEIRVMVDSPSSFQWKSSQGTSFLFAKR